MVAVSIVYLDDRKRVLEELRALRAQLPDAVAIVAGGAGARQLGAELAEAGVRVVDGPGDVATELRRAGGASPVV
jgi:hypothetical protein